jgi:hypothetical protein
MTYSIFFLYQLESRSKFEIRANLSEFYFGFEILKDNIYFLNIVICPLKGGII